MVESLEAETENAEGDLYVVESAESLAQVGLHHGAAGDSGGFVDAAGQAGEIFALIGGDRFVLVFKDGDCTDDRAVRVADRDGAGADGNFVSGFVVEETEGVSGAGGFDGLGERTSLAAEFASRLIAVEQGVRDAGLADDFVAGMTSDAFGAVAPEDYFFLRVDDAEADGQAFQDAAAEFEIVECGHGGWVCLPGDGST